MAKEGSGFYPEFKDKVFSSAQKRGLGQPQWDDILYVASDTLETSQALQEKEVSSRGVRRDLAYTLHFGRPEIATERNASQSQDLYAQAVGEMLADIVSFTKTQEFLCDPANRKITGQFLKFLADYVEDKGKVVRNPEAIKLAQVKEKVLSATLDGFVAQMKSAFPEPTAPQGREDLLPTILEKNKQFVAVILDGFSKFTLEKARSIVTQDQPILLLDVRDEMGDAHNRGITGYQVVDTVERMGDPFTKYLLHRNGLLAPDDYVPPCRMPNALIIDHGLEALSYAKTIREKTVRPAHLLPSLLRNSTILHLIMDLDEAGDMSERAEQDYFMVRFGGRVSRDFIKFHAAVGNALSPKSEGERFRYNVRVTDEVKQFLLQAATIIDKGDELYAEARMLGTLFTSDNQTKEVLIAAGLTADHLDNWYEAITAHQRKREEARKGKPEEKDKKEKTEGEFKISDRQLKDLMEQYATDLTKMALEGKIDPVIGRNEELYQMMRALLQRGRSNPLLLGEPGVGKTALFNGLAQVIASGRAPKALIGAQIMVLDLSAMNSGAMYRGQFEARLLPIIQGVAERNAKGDKPLIILCIDELHTAFMAGVAEGTPGAGELLKPYLTRGELSIVGATTQRDYAKYIAIDTAMDRRFQTIFIDEPGYKDTLEIIQGLKEQYATHHQLQIEDALLATIVKLSSRYLPNQKQPDKALRVLDAAMARAKMQEKGLVEEVDIIEAIAEEAKIDPEFLRAGEEEKFLSLKKELPKQVLGQPQATTYIAEALITAKADLQDPKKPLGVFLLLGPTGVGKTETGRALSRLLHGSESNLIRIDMSDFMEKHEASKLFGAPPGYVGYGEEGQLTGEVRRKPYSVVVLDEVEKAHPEVLKQLLQIFEEGEKVDGQGRRISFRNTIILMTSNLGAQSAIGEAEGEGLDPHTQPEEWTKITSPIYEMAAKTHFAPEFLNRIDRQILYLPLSQGVIRDLVDTEVDVLSQRVVSKYGPGLRLNMVVRDELARAGYNATYGARELKRTIRDRLTQPLANWILENKSQLAAGKEIEITGLNSQFNAEVVSAQSEESKV